MPEVAGTTGCTRVVADPADNPTRFTYSFNFRLQQAQVNRTGGEEEETKGVQRGREGGEKGE